MRKFHYNPTDILIITPIFYGSSSGAATYYKLLAKEFIKKNFSVAIISEKAIQPNGLSHFGIFPKRCSFDRNLMRDLASYAIQNFSYLLIPKIIRHVQPKTILIHSSFYNLPGLFPIVMESIRKANPNIRFVIDVRDRMLPGIWIRRTAKFKNFIACSENVKKYLCNKGLNPESVHLIPVIQEPIKIQNALTMKVISSLGLVGRKYIFYAGLVKQQKAIDSILKAFIMHIRKILPDTKLVISGLLKTSNREIRRLLKDDGVIYIGNRERDEVLSLMSKASLCINLSPNEGMPRSSLESLALRRQTALPPNVPEFEKYCRPFIIDSDHPKEIADMLISILRCPSKPQYPIASHYPENVVNQYLPVLGL